MEFRIYNESEGGTRKNTPDDNKGRQLNTKLQYYNVRYGDVNAKVRDLIIHEKKLLVKKLERKLMTIREDDAEKKVTLELRSIYEKYTNQLERGTACRYPLKKLQYIEFQDVLWAHQGEFYALPAQPKSKKRKELTRAVFFATVDGKFIYLHNRDKVIKAPGIKAKNPDYHKD